MMVVIGVIFILAGFFLGPFTVVAFRDEEMPSWLEKSGEKISVGLIVIGFTVLGVAALSALLG